MTARLGAVTLAKGTAVAPVPDVADGKTPDLAAGVKITPGSRRRHNQVKRFTSDGQLVKVFGRPEGRGDGPYVPTEFRGLTDIEADAEGVLSAEQLDAIFDPHAFLARAGVVFERVAGLEF
mgnify:CR=1 FL=1